MAWPHAQSDWAEQLAETQKTYCEIIQSICTFESVVLIVPDSAAVQTQLTASGNDLSKVRLVELQTDDTWARDFGPLCVETHEGLILLDFSFNGWGRKFSATQDNLATKGLIRAGVFGGNASRSIDLVLEGGSIDSDGRGTLMTTTNCLLEKNRNPQLSQAALESQLKTYFGAEKILWLEYGLLEGDDTDSHIDTLARFAPGRKIVYQGCRDRSDTHFSELQKMRNQLENFTDAEGSCYNLLELPMPEARYDKHGQRLPASYANFLIINKAVLVPTYKSHSDQEALNIISRAFPHREIIAIDCLSLIQQHGSLHCVTMQLPAGVLA